jgi:hypothetical protein
MLIVNSPQFFLLGLPTAQGLWAQVIVLLAVDLMFILVFGVNLQRSPMKELAPT